MEQPPSSPEQLSGVRRSHFAAVPRSRYLMQSFLASGIRSETQRTRSRRFVLDWAAQKWPGMIPLSAYEGIAFEHDQAGLRISASANGDGTLWAFRSEHLGQEPTQARTWVTEAVVTELDKADAFGVRNSCSTIGHDSVPTSSPRFLSAFVKHLSLTDGPIPVIGRPHDEVNDVETFASFLTALFSKARKLPMVVTSRTVGAAGAACGPDLNELARKTQGLAHIYVLSAAASFWLTDACGKAGGVFNGAIRVYYPGYNLDSDRNTHPLYLAQRIVEWESGIGSGPAAFVQYLSRLLHLHSVSVPEVVDQLPSYFAIRRNLLDTPNKSVADEMEILRVEVLEATRHADDWRAVATDRDDEARARKDENLVLRAQVATLTHEVKRLRAASRDAPAATPKSYYEISEWVAANFADKLFLHSRAARNLKSATFERVELVCAALRLLAEAYWPLKMATDDTRAELARAWEHGMRELGIDYSPTGMAESRMGEFRDAYTIDYQLGQSSRQVMGPHLRYGSNKDNRYCMRVYFLWDDERDLIVIGHLPSHLDTRAS